MNMKRIAEMNPVRSICHLVSARRGPTAQWSDLCPEKRGEPVRHRLLATDEVAQYVL